jgi:hypothetical protein|tara:strand:- start:23 stop:337 length:315 start_codon:yes stop_codon:yes gene_type:complete
MTYSFTNTSFWTNFLKKPVSSVVNVPNLTAWKLSRISAEVDDMINRPVHPLDNVFPFNTNSVITHENDYENKQSYDHDYDNYNLDYPSDAEDMDDCMYSSDEDI